MVQVKVDVTGFFFSRDVQVDANATVRDVMDAAVAANKTARPNEALLQYSADFKEEFLDGIFILHRNGSAKSRQVSGGAPARQYDDGFFSFRDDQIEIGAGPFGTTRFVPRDPNASRALAWQFYVYKDTPEGLVDLSRSKLGGLNRQVEAFSVARPFVGATDQDKYQVVWRLVALALRPDQLSGPESLMLSGLFT